MAEFRDLREASDEKSQCLIFLTVILTWIGNKDKPEECKHIKVFDGYLDKDLVKEIERIAFSSNKVVLPVMRKRARILVTNIDQMIGADIRTDTRAKNIDFIY